ncbi:uncharacterized protein PV06_03208 [Exophiala oligosperma]|uniref:HIT-type domain-containing protein n=1 Tax=Exophiala oligosperma TaxID=215243 RepID=A0A0D2DQH4_9EURO|nr:uncharacterized protein PV06_03208 [Exophiala oligosperma]KIW44760.1 hypothetical protein PV06_03208 [Exophiala oligosperma]
MPLIEELPVSGVSRISHGWAYVPDTAATIPTVQPSSRKRGRDGNTAASNAQAAHKLSAKQEKAIQQRLNDLGKENHREVHIPIPKRETAGAGTAARVKSTPNVRRILGYSRTFQHYLADEEAGVNVYGAAAVAAAAAVAGGGGAGASSASNTASSSKNVVDVRKRTDSKASAKKRTTSSAKEAKKTTRAKGGRTRGKASAVATEEEEEEDAEMVDATNASAAVDVKRETTEAPAEQDVTQPTDATEKEQQADKYDPALDKDPLLKTRDVPKPPTDRVLQALLAEPTLSYNMARAKPLEGADKSVFEIRTGSNVLVAKPQRWFCAVCGYWGKVRCRQGCGERVCGLLECWRGHEGVCALAGY